MKAVHSGWENFPSLALYKVTSTVYQVQQKLKRVIVEHSHAVPMKSMGHQLTFTFSLQINDITFLPPKFS